MEVVAAKIEERWTTMTAIVIAALRVVRCRSCSQWLRKQDVQ
jgi:hypothetical protein